GDQAAERERQELERDRVDQRGGEPAEHDVGRDLPDDVGNAEGEPREPHEQEREPALHADPRLEPAPEPHLASLATLTCARARGGTPPPARSPPPAAAPRPP